MAKALVDILIIGAGASGAAVAWRLSDAGFRVLCLEQGRWQKPQEYPTRFADWEFRGATSFDMVPHLEAWVEQGNAPERVIAVQPGFLGGPPSASRPLCPWPKTAQYNGTGSTQDAANFTCVTQ